MTAQAEPALVDSGWDRGWWRSQSDWESGWWPERVLPAGGGLVQLQAVEEVCGSLELQHRRGSLEAS